MSDCIEINWPFVPTTACASTGGDDEFSEVALQPVKSADIKSKTNAILMLGEYQSVHPSNRDMDGILNGCQIATIYVSPLSYSLPMTTKRRKRIDTLVCPECGEIGTLRKILYGMPDPETFDFEKYAVGGCCVSPDGIDPDVNCRACDWSGYRDGMEEK